MTTTSLEAILSSLKGWQNIEVWMVVRMLCQCTEDHTLDHKRKGQMCSHLLLCLGILSSSLWANNRRWGLDSLENYKSSRCLVMCKDDTIKHSLSIHKPVYVRIQFASLAGGPTELTDVEVGVL